MSVAVCSCSQAAIAYSSEVDSSSREESASKQQSGASPLIQSETKMLWLIGAMGVAADADVSALSARSSDRYSLHSQGRLTDANGHALTVFAAGADAVVQRDIVADHGD